MRNLKEKFDSARNRLLEFERKQPDDGSTEDSISPRPIVVFTGVTPERYQQFRNNEERKFHVFIRLVDGKVIVYDMPSPVHGHLLAEFIYMIRNWHGQLLVSTDVDLNVGNNTYSPDILVQPLLVPVVLPTVMDPRMVLEIGKTESLQSLHDLPGDYFSAGTNIQVYLGIKVWPRRVNGTAAMLALLYLRNNVIPNPSSNTPPTITLPNTVPNITISFGTAPLNHELLAFVANTSIPNHRITGFLQPGDIACTAPNMPNYQIAISTNLLFFGNPMGPPPGVPNNFNLDLWIVQGRTLIYLP
ncbi:3866_t:CDS:1 [Ambispora leptoticha]|uniref:3866_t:CDS:1 n=1 Tax=Ambispora leptoticha TaxID=144679 RepID=A0A9N9FMM1_9GLOM|nr:3866_t:CDS:1 [Ambispora leptoticha]